MQYDKKYFLPVSIFYKITWQLDIIICRPKL